MLNEQEVLRFAQASGEVIKRASAEHEKHAKTAAAVRDRAIKMAEYLVSKGFCSAVQKQAAIADLRDPLKSFEILKRAVDQLTIARTELAAAQKTATTELGAPDDEGRSGLSNVLRAGDNAMVGGHWPGIRESDMALYEHALK